jgi:3-oxoacyl-[acyl-carrier protein] reductase
MQLLPSKYAIVTGATSGIGKQIALTFAHNGAFVFAIGTSQEKADLLREEAEQQGVLHLIQIHLCNVSNHDEVKSLFAKILEQVPRIDILVNNAGITKDGLLVRMNEADITSVFDINLKACFYTCQEVLRSMMKSRSGRIINISSIVGLVGNAGQTNYAASKAGMIGLTKSLAKEVGSRNILVNCIAPGFIETSMTEKLKADAKTKAEESIPLHRLGNVTDIANTTLFLASDLSSYITGQVLVVDGGLSMGF